MIECILRFNVGTYVFYSTQFVFRKEGVLPADDQDYYPIEAYGEFENPIGAVDPANAAGRPMAHIAADLRVGRREPTFPRWISISAGERTIDAAGDARAPSILWLRWYCLRANGEICDTSV